MLSLFRTGHRQKTDIIQRWTPVLLSARYSQPTLPEVMNRSTAKILIDEWLQHYEKASSEEKIGLAVLAYRLNINRYALGMLIAESDYCLKGIKILAYLADESAWNTLKAITLQDDLELALSAKNALQKINPGRAQREDLDD